MRIRAFLSLLLIALWPLSADCKQRIPFHPVSGLIQLNASLNGKTPVPVLLDLGAGTMTLSATQWRLLGLTVSSVYTGFRMGGQRLDLSIGGPLHLTMGSYDVEIPYAARWKGLGQANALIPALAFRNTPLTIDYANDMLTLEDAGSLAALERTGEQVPLLTSDDRGVQLDLFARFDFGNGQSGLCIIDTGSQGVFVNTRFAQRLGINLADPHLKHIRTDQAEAVVASVPEVTLQGAPSTKHANDRVIFADMIYDCNVGNEFWAGKALTVDIPHSRIIVNTPPAKMGTAK